MTNEETPPEGKEASKGPPCTCFHAPEQHGRAPDGCQALNWAGARCSCLWGRPMH